MKNYHGDKHPLRISDRLLYCVRSGIADARQLSIIQKFIPDFAVICSNRQQITVSD